MGCVYSRIDAKHLHPILTIRSKSAFKFPYNINSGNMFSVKGRYFHAGGLLASGTASFVYEWDEAAGWELFRNIPGLAYYGILSVLPYNDQ